MGFMKKVEKELIVKIFLSVYYVSGPTDHGDSQEAAPSNVGNQDQRQIQMTSHCSCPHRTDLLVALGHLISLS